MDPEIKRLIRALKRHGYHMKNTTSNRIKVIDDQGHLVTVIPKRASFLNRGYDNLLAAIRQRTGIDFTKEK